MPQPLLVYDGDCKVCCQQVENLQWIVGKRFDAESFRSASFFIRHPNLSEEECMKAVQFVDGKGRQYAGAEAVAQVVGLVWYFKPLAGMYYIPGVRQLWDRFYEVIAKNRFRL